MNSLTSSAAAALDQPVVLALAGGGCSPRIYDSVHTPGIRWQALDWAQGAGPFDPLSVADRIGTALERHDAPVALAGHSVGGFIALQVAIRYPEQVAALVISNTGASTEGHGDPELPRRVLHAWDDAAQQAFLRACFVHAPPAPLWAELRRYLAALDPAGFAETVVGLRQLDAGPDLGRIRCPTLIAHGRLDTRRPVSAAQALAAGIPGARLVLLPGGHTPMVDCAADYAAAVGTFLSGVGLTKCQTGVGASTSCSNHPESESS